MKALGFRVLHEFGAWDCKVSGSVSVSVRCCTGGSVSRGFTNRDVLDYQPPVKREARIEIPRVSLINNTPKPVRKGQRLASSIEP